MLNKIWVKNFKAHADTKIEPRRITLFIGPNNSGKSSLGQALLLLRQAATRNNNALCTSIQRKSPSSQDPYLYSDDQLIDLGDFDRVVRRGEQDLLIGLEGTVGAPRIPEYYGSLFLSLEVLVRNNAIAFYKGHTESASPPQTERSIHFTWQWSPGSLLPPITITVPNGRFVIRPSGNFAILSGAELNYDSTVTPNDAAAAQSLQEELAGAPKSLLKSVHPIFPLRGLEEWGAPLIATPTRNLERMSVSDRTVALLNMLAHDLNLQERVSDWLEDLIGCRIKVPLLPNYRVTMLTQPIHSRGTDSLFMNEGTGANQLPFILVPIGITPPGETISLTEPEAHLHPKMQSKLTSLLLTLSHKENRQFIIETHSEHVLHSVLLEVAKGRLATRDLAIYYFQNVDGLAKCQLLEVTEKGQVPGGLPEFFEHSLSEMSELLAAQEKN